MAQQTITEHQSRVLAQAIQLYMKVEDINPNQFIQMLGDLSSQCIHDKFDSFAKQSVLPTVG